jgi:amphi-Trp domain-containing protein
MSGATSFKHETVQDLESIVAYLDAVKEGLVAGKLVLASRGKELVLEPKGLVTFSVEARYKGDRRKLALHFAWKESPLFEATDDPLTINAP